MCMGREWIRMEWICQATIQIIHCGTGKVLGSSETIFACDGSSATFRVLFKVSYSLHQLWLIFIGLRSQLRYRRASHTSPRLVSKVLTRITELKDSGGSSISRLVIWINISFHVEARLWMTGSGCVTFQFTYAAGNNNGTSVEDGQVPEIIFYTKLN